ncbi:MAG: hypothetical protein JXA41_09225 [Deltaproteobacteria bacterium]|nr:hypothetical protein [Deltaproteobacteria bacterium]
MTHTLNRRGLDNGRPGEEICVLSMIHYQDRNEETAEAMRELARTIIAYGPNNIMGSSVGATPEQIIESAAASGVITAVFTDKDTVGRLVREIKTKDPGISVVLSGLFSDIHDICEYAGLTEHTSNYAVGISGNAALLPDHITLEIATQCGHGLVSRHYIQHVACRIAEGKMTAREGAELLSKPCVCGIVNKKRTEEILLKMAELTSFTEGHEINYAVRQKRKFS